MSAVVDRSARATRLLREAGIAATVTHAGTQDEIAAVRTSADRLADVALHAPAIRALGFRYVALEIGVPEPERATD